MQEKQDRILRCVEQLLEAACKTSSSATAAPSGAKGTTPWLTEAALDIRLEPTDGDGSGGQCCGAGSAASGIICSEITSASTVADVPVLPAANGNGTAAPVGMQVDSCDGRDRSGHGCDCDSGDCDASASGSSSNALGFGSGSCDVERSRRQNSGVGNIGACANGDQTAAQINSSTGKDSSGHGCDSVSGDCGASDPRNFSSCSGTLVGGGSKDFGSANSGVAAGGNGNRGAGKVSSVDDGCRVGGSGARSGEVLEDTVVASHFCPNLVFIPGSKKQLQFTHPCKADLYGSAGRGRGRIGARLGGGSPLKDQLKMKAACGSRSLSMANQVPAGYLKAGSDDGQLLHPSYSHLASKKISLDVSNSDFLISTGHGGVEGSFAGAADFMVAATPNQPEYLEASPVVDAHHDTLFCVLPGLSAQEIAVDMMSTLSISTHSTSYQSRASDI